MAGIAARWLADRPETLILGPSRAAADELARAACGEGLLGVHRLTPMLLATELSAALRAKSEPRLLGSGPQDGLAPVSRLGMEALAARIVARLQREGKLSYFRPVVDTPGFARALALTLDELRNEAVPPVELAKAGLPGADLAQLAVIYEEELRERALADRALTF